MDTGSRIKKYRDEYLKISQTELVDLVGVSQVTIGKWEQGKSIKHTDLKKLAEVFKIPVDFLLGDNSVNINQTNTENASNNVAGFEVIIKTPKNVVDAILDKVDKLIELLERKKE